MVFWIPRYFDPARRATACAASRGQDGLKWQLDLPLHAVLTLRAVPQRVRHHAAGAFRILFFGFSVCRLSAGIHLVPQESQLTAKKGLGSYPAKH
ncbi:MAG: hypothetical protein QM296_04440 [Bacillota bacterium]|nr:hypothetical protein [Bacillota bacterium]